MLILCISYHRHTYLVEGGGEGVSWQECPWLPSADAIIIYSHNQLPHYNYITIELIPEIVLRGEHLAYIYTGHYSQPIYTQLHQTKSD